MAPRLVDFAGLPEKGRILDVGSGTGALAFAVGERHGQARIVGIDPSSQYVSYAGSRNPFGDRVTFEVGDAQQLHFADSSFDAAASLLVFNFIPDPAKALREVRRVTKPGGVISAAVWDYGKGMQMLRIFWDAAIAVNPAAGKLDEKNMPLCRAGELSALWRQQRLQDIREQPIDVIMTFTSFADYWEPFLLGQGPAGAYAHGLSRDALEALRGHIKNRLAASSESAAIHLQARVWCVRGSVPTPA
ncbi:MAG: methyltransferase domain-containing protein [Bryobacteraceae bacterium]